MANKYGYYLCSSCGTKYSSKYKACPSCSRPADKDTKRLPPDKYSEYVPIEEENMIQDWVCDYCGVSNDVKSTVCSGCGASRYKETKGQLQYEQEKNGEQVQEAYKDIQGVDSWTCDYCETENPVTSDICKNCGATRGTDIEQNFDNVSEQKSSANLGEPQTDNHQKSTAFNSFFERNFSQNHNHSFNLSQHTNLLRRIFLGLGIGILLTLLIVFLIWLFKPIEHKAVVQGFEWDRGIAIETFTRYDESGWTVPSGAKVKYTREEVHHYNQVIDHYETSYKSVTHTVDDGYETSYKDLGNGQWKEVQKHKTHIEYSKVPVEIPVYKSVPVYQTKYYYEIGRWKHTNDIITTGTTKEVEWGKCNYPTSVINPKYNDSRQGKRTEHYYVTFINHKGKVDKQEYSYNEWITIQVGNTITYTRFRFQ